jgi:hypothetical protein
MTIGGWFERRDDGNLRDKDYGHFSKPHAAIAHC